MNRNACRRAVSQTVKIAVCPAAFYVLCFSALTWPRITEFSTHLFAADGDGYQNVWNIWWVNRAVLQLHQSPWHTDHLRYLADPERYPDGIPLLAHTLTAFNGFASIPFLRFLTPEQCYNLMTIFSFVATGWTMFLLAYSLCAAYWPSIVSGYIFTFCNYHFAHAEGHLNFVSMEWIPLFVLFWFRCMTSPRIWSAIAAGLALFLVLLCEYNYFFYCLLIAVIIFGWNAFRTRRPLFFLGKNYLPTLIAFAATVLVTSGPIVIPLLQLHARDPLNGHDPELNSMDLFAPFIYGGHWRFNELTERYWRSAMGGNIHESSVYLGWSVIAMLAYAWFRRREITLEGLRLWFFVLVFFYVLALGPSLHAELLSPGKPIGHRQSLPYAWLAAVVPGMEVSGFPLRMAVMIVFAAALICAGALKLLFAKSTWHRIAAVVLLGILVVEYLPTEIPSIEPQMPGYVGVLRNLPRDGGVLDAAGLSYRDKISTISPEALSWDMYGWTPAMYYQTFHRKPIAFGFLPRQPQSVHARDVEVARALINQQWLTLRDQFDLRYLVLKDVSPAIVASPYLRVLHQENDVYVLAVERPTFREVAIPIDPVVTRELRRLNGTWESSGNDPVMVFELPKRELVSAIRVKCRFEPGDAPVRMQFFWRSDENIPFLETERTQTLELPRSAFEQIVTVLVNDTISQLRIDPDTQPCQFSISEITLFLPANERK